MVRGERTPIELVQDFNVHPGRSVSGATISLGRDGVFGEAIKAEPQSTIDDKNLLAKTGELSPDNGFCSPQPAWRGCSRARKERRSYVSLSTRRHAMGLHRLNGQGFFSGTRFGRAGAISSGLAAFRWKTAACCAQKHWSEMRRGADLGHRQPAVGLGTGKSRSME